MKNTHFFSKITSAGVAVLLALTAAFYAVAPVHAQESQEDIIPEKSEVVAQADAVMPGDVENVTALAGDGKVTLSWNVATDNVGVKGYKIYYGTKSVSSDGDQYTMGPIDVGNKITYEVTNLTNGTPYYFAVTAYDEAGNESENYSLEVSSTPAHGAADTEAPKVTKAEAVDKNTVKVTFSEAVTLPVQNPAAVFTVKNDSTQVVLEVTKAVLDTADTSNKTVVLTTATQQPGASYIVTAGIQIKDAAGNPIVSGTSDTAVFTGTDIEPAGATTQQTSDDKEAPQLVKVEASDNTHVKVTFSEKVKLSPDATQNFIITEETNTDNILEVSAAELDAAGTVATVTTAAQKGMNYNMIVVEVSDMAGNLISVDNNATVFAGKTAGAAEPVSPTPPPADGTDTTPPEDASEFIAKMVNTLVRLSWKASPNTAGDLAAYVLYKSTDGVAYGDSTEIGKDATSFDMSNLVPGVKYFFKLVARDASGNESSGVITTFMLPETGPGLALLAVGSLVAGKWMKKKKARK